MVWQKGNGMVLAVKLYYINPESKKYFEFMKMAEI
jgi:hypothetical protein